METYSNFRIACLCEDLSEVERAVKRLAQVSGQDVTAQFCEKDSDTTCLVDVMGVEPQEIDGIDIDLVLVQLLDEEAIEWKMRRVGGTFSDEIDDWEDADTYVSEFCEQQEGAWKPFKESHDKVSMPLDVPKHWHY